MAFMDSLPLALEVPVNAPLDRNSAVNNAYAKAMNLIQQGKTKVSGTDFVTSGPNSPNVSQTGENNLHVGMGRSNSLQQSTSKGGNLTVDLLPQKSTTAQNSLDAGPLSDQVSISVGTGSFGAAPSGESTTVQLTKDGGSNAAISEGEAKATIGQANVNTDVSQANTSGNSAEIDNTNTAEIAQVGVNTDAGNESFISNSGMATVEQKEVGKPSTPTDSKPVNTTNAESNQAVTIDQLGADANNTAVVSDNLLVNTTQTAVSTDPATLVRNTTIADDNVSVNTSQTTRNGNAGAVYTNNGIVTHSSVVDSGDENGVGVFGAASATVEQYSKNVALTGALVDGASSVSLDQGGSNTDATAVVSNSSGTIRQGIDNSGPTGSAITQTVDQRLGVTTPVVSRPEADLAATGNLDAQLNANGPMNVLQQQNLGQDSSLSSQGGIGDVNVLQNSQNSGSQVASVDKNLGNVIVGQSAKNSGDQGAIVTDSVAPGIVVVQDNDQSRDGTVVVSGNVAQDGIAIGQINHASTDSPNTLTALAQGNMVINPNGSLGTIAVVQDSQRATGTIGAEADNNVANTSISQSTTADTDISGILVNGNIGDVKTSQTAIGTDPNAPISAKTGSSVANTLGTTVQGVAKQNTTGSTTVLNDGTLGAVSVFDAQQNTTGNTTLNVSNASNTGDQPAFATAFVGDPNAATTAVGDVAVASQTVGATGTQTVNLNNNKGNQTVSTQELDNGERSYNVTNADRGTVTLATNSADTGARQAGQSLPTTKTTIDGGKDVQLAVSNRTVDQGSLSLSASNLTAPREKPDVVALSDNPLDPNTQLVAQGDFAAIENKQGGDGSASLSMTNMKGDSAAVVSNVGSEANAKGEVGSTLTLDHITGNAASHIQQADVAGDVATSTTHVTGNSDQSVVSVGATKTTAIQEDVDGVAHTNLNVLNSGKTDVSVQSGAFGTGKVDGTVVNGAATTITGTGGVSQTNTATVLDLPTENGTQPAGTYTSSTTKTIVAQDNSLVGVGGDVSKTTANVGMAADNSGTATLGNITEDRKEVGILTDNSAKIADGTITSNTTNTGLVLDGSTKIGGKINETVTGANVVQLNDKALLSAGDLNYAVDSKVVQGKLTAVSDGKADIELSAKSINAGVSVKANGGEMTLKAPDMKAVINTAGENGLDVINVIAGGDGKADTLVLQDQDGKVTTMKVEFKDANSTFNAGNSDNNFEFNNTSDGDVTVNYSGTFDSNRLKSTGTGKGKVIFQPNPSLSLSPALDKPIPPTPIILPITPDIVTPKVDAATVNANP